MSNYCAVDQAVRRAFTLMYGHVRGRFMRDTLGFTKEKFSEMLRQDKNYEQFNALYQRWLKEIHAADSDGSDLSAVFANAETQLNSLALRYPEDSLVDDSVPPHYALDPKQIPDGLVIEPAIRKMLLNPAPGASLAYLNGLRKAYKLPAIPTEEEYEAAIRKKRPRPALKAPAQPKPRPEITLDAPLSSPTAHSSQPAAAPKSEPWIITQKEIEDALYMPQWQKITELRWLDAGRVPPDKREEGLIKICAFARKKLEEYANKFEIPKEGFANRPPGPEPSYRVAAELGLPESKLNAIMNEFTGMTARETWDFLRMDKASPFISNSVRELMDTVATSHSLTQDAGVSGLRIAKRLSGMTYEQLAEDMGFRNVSRLKRGCLNRFAMTLGRIEISELGRIAPDSRTNANEMAVAMRSRSVQFGSPLSETILSLTPVQLREGLKDPGAFLSEIEEELVVHPKNIQTDGTLTYSDEFMYENRMALKTAHEQAYWNAKVHPERIYVSMDTVIERHVRRTCSRRASPGPRWNAKPAK